MNENMPTTFQTKKLVYLQLFLLLNLVDSFKELSMRLCSALLVKRKRMSLKSFSCPLLILACTFQLLLSYFPVLISPWVIIAIQLRKHLEWKSHLLKFHSKPMVFTCASTDNLSPDNLLGFDGFTCLGSLTTDSGVELSVTRITALKLFYECLVYTMN